MVVIGHYYYAIVPIQCPCATEYNLRGAQLLYPICYCYKIIRFNASSYFFVVQCTEL